MKANSKTPVQLAADATMLAAFAGAGWFKIAETDLGGSVATIDLASIPATYQHLLLIASLRTDRAGQVTDTVYLSLNADVTAANYDQRNVTTAVAGEFLATANARSLTSCPAATSPAGNFGTLELLIPNYSSATKNKLVRSTGRNWRDRNTAGLVLYDAVIGWASTAAINEITLSSATSSNFVSGCTVSLYGIKAGA